MLKEALSVEKTDTHLVGCWAARSAGTMVDRTATLMVGHLAHLKDKDWGHMMAGQRADLWGHHLAVA
jgi:hypothetical protein